MNTFGNIFSVSIFGESHGPLAGVVIDGVEPGIALGVEDFTADIARRKSGVRGTTPRIEADVPQLVSGVYEGHTTGAPLTILFANGNTRSGDYSRLKAVPRPGHADFTADIKYDGFQDPRGGGHFSGRLTLPVVAAGVVAKKVLAETVASETEGHVHFCAEARIVELGGVSRETALKRSSAACPDGRSQPDAELWAPELEAAMEEGDSLGAVVECVVDGMPAGLGEPFWDSVESCIAHAVFAIPGVRGIEFGDGFRAARLKGSEHNDCFVPDVPRHGLVTPATNHAGGVNGGITNGNPLVFRVAFKPTSSIRKAQRTYDFAAGTLTDLQVPGRHDTCFALRTPVIVEAMAAIVLADLIDRA
ncbi:MAG: chorismate synthase [Bacteroidales bacterium]|nr:chorismate synthase [Bacteroidales bacterium]